MPCVPVAGINMGVFTVPPIGSGVWIEFERGDPDYPIWVGGFWGSAAETPALAKAVPPGLAGITLQTTLKNGIVVSDTPGPTGGILIQTTTGAMISVSDVGHHHLERQGRDHQHDRPDDRHEPRRADGDLRRRPMPAPILHLGATVLCTHAGQATPVAPFPRVTVSAQPVVTLTQPVRVAGCALTGTPTPPCVTGQFVMGAARVLAGGAPVATHDRASRSACRPARR